VKLITILFTLIFIASGYGHAQKSTTHQNLYWLRYYNQLSINQKFIWHNEIEERRFFQNNKANNLIIHSRLHYKIKPNLDVAAGLTYSEQGSQSPNTTTNFKVPEIRPVQELNYTLPISRKFALQQRLRLDQRFIRSNDGSELQHGYRFNLRFRLSFQLLYKLNSDTSKKQTTVKIANELMINAGKNITYNQFDQNRIYIAIQQDFNKNIALELGYLKIYQQKAVGNQFLNRDIFRLSLYHRLRI